MSAKNISGKYGEVYAQKHLKENGYEILKLNYKTKISEIDIIAKDGDTLCFVEVKTRKSKDFGGGYEAVDQFKRNKMILGARSYLAFHQNDCDIRFDVVEVYGEINADGFRVSQINVLKNAFYAD